MYFIDFGSCGWIRTRTEAKRIVYSGSSKVLLWSTIVSRIKYIFMFHREKSIYMRVDLSLSLLLLSTSFIPHWRFISRLLWHRQRRQAVVEVKRRRRNVRSPMWLVNRFQTNPVLDKDNFLTANCRTGNTRQMVVIIHPILHSVGCSGVLASF